jgi:hypothetical protein
MDMIGIDGLGPISPVSGEHKYILIVVDYFTRYAWAQACPAINGSVVSGVVASIARTFGLPRSVYTDNASYFVEGVFPDYLTVRGVRQFPAPKTHPSSVGLLERYVQLVLYGIRKIVVAGGDINQWSSYLDQVVHSMNTRVVRVHGYSPAELMFGYNPVVHHHEFTVRDNQAAQDLQDRHRRWNHQEDDAGLLGPQQDVHLAARDERTEDVRQRYLTRFVQQQDRQGRFAPPKEGDLVLLRRAALDNRYDKKLEARWEGPFRLGNIAHHGRSGRLYDITTGQLVKTKPSGLKDRIHLDDLRVYVTRKSPREEKDAGEGAEAVSIVEWARVCWKGKDAGEWALVGTETGRSVDLRCMMEEDVFLAISADERVLVLEKMGIDEGSVESERRKRRDYMGSV